MAVSIVMTGTGRNCTLTSGSSSIVVSSATGLVVGATIQGTGIPTGTRIASISGTTVTMENGLGAPVNATASGTQSLIFSSVWGSVVTVSMSAAGDTANMDSIFNAGFGVKQRGLAVREIFFPGAMGLIWRDMVAGSVFDFQNWTIEFGSGGYWAWSQSSIFGELRGGYLVNGTQFIKASGPTFISNNFKNSALGGANMFIDTATGTVTGTFRMNNMRTVYQVGSNTAPFFSCGRMNCIVDNMILDYQGGSGANAGIGAAFGTINNTTIVRANSGIGNPNPGNFATINGLSYSGIYTDSPNHKFSIPNNYVMEGYAPQVLSTQLLGGFQDNTTETFANIDLSTAGWGLNDLKTKYQRYGGPNEIRFPRRVTLQFNDSNAADLAGVTLYIRSGATSVINAVQAGDYNANTQALVLNWTGSVASYRVANTITDTIEQVAQVRKYGYQQQSVAYSLNLAGYSQPFFLLADASLTGISESTAAAITTAGINWAAKTITPTASLSYDQINARMAWELAQTTNSAQADPRTIVGSQLTLATGWTLVVNNGITITAGANITFMSVPTVTLNGTGSIRAIYGTSAGVSTILELRDVSDGSAYIIANNSTQATILYGTNATGSAQTYTAYFPPGSAGTQVLVARERYGYQRSAEVLTLAAGGMWYTFVDIPDVGISNTSQSAVAAYTTVENADKFYDRTALFRLTEAGIKLGQIATRDGTSVRVAGYSKVINQSAASVYAISGATITLKATGYANGVKFTNTVLDSDKTLTAATNEVISADFEDANGDSGLTILGGDGTFELWKVTTSTATADYQTGTKLTAPTIGNTRFRFIGVTGFDIVGVDINSNVRRRTSMAKGVYEQAFYVGDQIQLAQAPEVLEINNKVDLLAVDIEAVKGSGFATGKHSLVKLKQHVTNMNQA